ncbi:hypothetical protein OPV22_006329 [Ensete ventricosum]|uniref:Uncharacterized protein n=1 Tax=Ensete ventricosum TaxID=4639 RepID=A0AAV8RIJ1_ENSVE|nr:hypothetical protein OPV22_006329 [Ensete ventricosum]
MDPQGPISPVLPHPVSHVDYSAWRRLAVLHKASELCEAQDYSGAYDDDRSNELAEQSDVIGGFMQQIKTGRWRTRRSTHLSPMGDETSRHLKSQTKHVSQVKAGGWRLGGCFFLHPIPPHTLLSLTELTPWIVREGRDRQRLIKAKKESRHESVTGKVAL